MDYAHWLFVIRRKSSGSRITIGPRASSSAGILNSNKRGPAHRTSEIIVFWNLAPLERSRYGEVRLVVVQKCTATHSARHELAGPREMLDWDDLRFFLAVARTGSPSAAARSHPQPVGFIEDEPQTCHVVCSQVAHRVES
jgi:hypothetical protein